MLSVRDSQGKEITDKNHIGHINPYRYRSYRYNSETKLYYLNNRYYNPEWGRFINADSLLETPNHQILEDNLYAYCYNNPVNLADKDGRFGIITWIIIGAVAGAIIGGTTAAIVSYKEDGEVDAEDVAMG